MVTAVRVVDDGDPRAVAAPAELPFTPDWDLLDR
jgi:hypothetical protein